mmetsp:Transcript_21427/g.44637  ORF Transcript_21427/g.44637 Transcript_21427/m.44637 type:complete len:635 (-) Transcript_21427:70-1974(-)
MAMYQVHSANDLREWKAWLAKGAVSFKIDPHFLPGQTQFKLSHDTPTFFERKPYSTLDDLLDFFTVEPPKTAFNKTITIALCFKSAPDVCSEYPLLHPWAGQWLDQANDFFQKADNAVKEAKSKFDIILEFVLDGDAKPCDCKAELFMPWNSVWIEKDECSKECSSTDDGFCERFTILNDQDSSDWHGMSSAGYGKFGSSYDTPLQLWEPDYQGSITTFVNDYIHGRDVLNTPSGGGLKFAINIDPSMFDVLSSRSTLEGTEEARGFDKIVVGGEGGTSPTLTRAEDEQGLWNLEFTVSGMTAVKQVEIAEGTPQPFPSIGIKDISSFNTSKSPSDFNLNNGNCLVKFNKRCIWEKKHRPHRVKFSGVMTSAASAPLGDDSNLVFTSDGSRIFAGVDRSDGNEIEWRFIGLGNRVATAFLDDVVVVVMEGNHCYNSHHYNTRTTPLVCEPQVDDADSCPEILDYTIATKSNWIEWLSKDRGDKEGYVVTVCNDVLLHGSWGGGSKVSVDLFNIEEGKVGVLAAYESYKAKQESVCGTPVLGVDGIIVSSFAVSVHLGGFEGTQASLGVADKGIANIRHIATTFCLLFFLAYCYGRRYMGQIKSSKKNNRGKFDQTIIHTEMIKLKKKDANKEYV